MPELSGIEVVRRMRSPSPLTKALMLSAYDDDDYVLALLEAGASGYLLKTVHEKELIDAIRAVFLGELVLHPVIAMKIAKLWAQRGAPIKQKTSCELSPREVEIIELAAKGLRNKSIADELEISIRTVECHFSSIFSKLGVKNRIEAILEASSRNIVNVDEYSTAK
jgi:DNA-binding NarL/FixJ family response regulator